MKRLISILLLFAMVLALAGCSEKYRTDITREEIIAVYEAAGYEVWTDTYEDMDSGAVAYVQANHPDGDYIYFTFFENTEDAEAYKKELNHSGWKYLLSVIFGDPSWERMKVYGCICVSYDDPNLFYPFEGLLTAN